MGNKTVDLKRFNNSWYKPGNKIKILFWYIFNRVFLNTSIPYSSALKRAVLKLFGAKIGDGVVIKPRVIVKYPWLLKVGDNVWIGENVWIDNLAMVTIESDVCISQGAMLLCGNHDYTKSTFDLMVGEIILEKGTWIGAKAVVCPGVICKTHSVLSVGSVAKGILDAFSVFQGNPAVKVKERIIED